MSNREMRKLRKEAAQRRRRVIFNNDGGEPYKGGAASTPQELLAQRTTDLAGSHVDSIFYSTDHGFNYYSHRTSVAEVRYDDHGHMKALIEQGTDPLQIHVDFCRRQGMEIFWSMRVNDEHSSWGSHLLSRFHKDNPECLLGTKDEPPPFGPWSGVDYARPEVRDHAFRCIEDVCTRYDVDGVEIDFFRQLTCFKRLAWGRQIGQEERDMMSEYLRRVRVRLDEIGSRRGKPLLIAVRVPDSVGYCRAMGFDLVKWLEEDVIDIMVVGGYFWLQPWKRSVELGHKYDVPVYPSLDGSRVGAYPWVIGRKEGVPWPECQVARRSAEGYRAHSMNALAANADGIYVYNFNYFFEQSHPVWRELGDAETLATLDKIYHVSVMGRGHPDLDHYLPGGQGERFMHMPMLSPDFPQELLKDVPLRTTLAVADDLPAAIEKGLAPELKLNVQLENLPASKDLTVKLTGQALCNAELTWETDIPETWQEYAVDPHTVKKGANAVEITLTADTDVKHPCVLHDVQLRVNYGKPG